MIDDGAWVRHRPARHTSGFADIVGEREHGDDHRLSSRVAAAYRHSLSLHNPDGSLWAVDLEDVKAADHQVLVGEDIEGIADFLRRPMQSAMHYGFDELCRQDTWTHGTSSLIREPDWLYDNLLRFAEAIGAVPLAYPELLPSVAHETMGVEPLLNVLDEAVGFQIDFPNPFEGERGLGTSRGVASYRAIQSLYQAYRIWQLTRQCAQPSVLEIGGGTGRTAYYAMKFGISRYRIVDIPMTGAAQANFLGRVLDQEHIGLSGEADAAGKPIRIVMPHAFFSSTEKYDLIANFDAITEMSRDTANLYWRHSKSLAPWFLSVNHEANHFSFRDIYNSGGGKSYVRQPYWMRRGYVEELVGL